MYKIKPNVFWHKMFLENYIFRLRFLRISVVSLYDKEQCIFTVTSFLSCRSLTELFIPRNLKSTDTMIIKIKNKRRILECLAVRQSGASLKALCLGSDSADPIWSGTFKRKNWKNGHQESFTSYTESECRSDSAQSHSG